jgi:mono/diheme cytochrome c family protein
MPSDFCAKFAIAKSVVFGARRTVFYMKISSSQMFRNFNNWCFSTIMFLFLAGSFNAQAQGGGDLFKAKCATCHHPFKDGTGPKLYGVKAVWEENGADEAVLIQWVKNWQDAAAANGYAASRVNLKPTAMTQFGNQLTDEQILSIFDWVDAQTEDTGGGGGAVAAGDGSGTVSAEEDESSLGWIWIVLFAVFATIILAVGGVRRQLKHAQAEVAGDDEAASMSYADELKKWAWLNRKYVGIVGLVIVISLVVALFQGLYSINVMENYQPSQPIDFPHATHAGINGIDCNYCHNSVTESKSAGLPTVNVCMNCHKQITGEGEQVAKIQKIYDAAGWDAENGVYTGKTKPIVWNKVHNLPDHVYFNHRQHVVVGGVDCKQCHGDMTQMTEVAKVQPVSELNKIEGNVQLTKATLTMGWCIECHGEKEIAPGVLTSIGSGYYDEIHNRLVKHNKNLYSGYLDDDKVTVKELGGWECAKCHY